MFDKTVDIVLPCWNQEEFTRKCLDSIKLNTKVPYRLVYVDNGSETDQKIFKSDFE